MLRLFLLLPLMLGCATTLKSQTVEFNLAMENTEQGDYYNSIDYNVPIVLEFYFNSCPACNENSGKVKRLASEYHGFFNQIIDVSIDCERSEYEHWIQKFGDSFPILNDCDRSLAESLGVRAYPTTIVLNAQHKVVYKTIGTWDEAKISKIKSYLKTSN